MHYRKPFLKISLLMVAFFVVLGVGGCVTAKQQMLDAGEKPLTEQELQILFASAPTDVEVTHPKGTTYVNHFPDGTQKATWDGGSNEGRYWIENGKVCGKYNGRPQRCSTAFKVAENQYKLFDDQGDYLGTLNFR